MPSAKSIVLRLIEDGVIPEEYEQEAVQELDRELSRRSRRLVHTLAALTSTHQFAMRFASMSRRSA